MEKEDEHMWGSPMAFSSTILFKDVTNFNETLFKEALETAEDVEVDRATHIGDGRVLVDYRTNNTDVNISYIRVGRDIYPVDGEWPHNQPAVVCVRELPPKVTEESIEDYLDFHDIEASNIVLCKEEGTANIELVNPGDVPKLIYGKHKIKKQKVEFVEASVPPLLPEAEENIDGGNDVTLSSFIDRQDINNDPPGLSSQLVFDPQKDHDYDNDFVLASFIDQQNICDEPLALEVFLPDSLLLHEQKESLIKSLVYLFVGPPHFLEVEEFRFDRNKAYFTFTDEEGVSKVMYDPPRNLLGSQIRISTTPVRDAEFVVSVSPPHCPMILLVKDLPPDFPDDLAKLQLEYLFDKRGHAVTDFMVENGCAYVKFKDQKAIGELISNPPDNSTLSGSPVEYTCAMDNMFTGLVGVPCVLVVDGVPTAFSGIVRTLNLYLKNVTGVAPQSCIVDGKQAIVRFENDEVARQLVRDPPTTPLFDNVLEFSIQPDTSHRPVVPSANYTDCRPVLPSAEYTNVSLSSTKARTMVHQISDPISNRNEISDSTKAITSLPSSKPPVPAPRRKFRPRSTSLIVQRLPNDYTDYHIKHRLESLARTDHNTEIDCKKVKLKNQMALVEVEGHIDISSLQSSLKERGNQMTISPLEPSNCLLFTSGKTLNKHDVFFFCEDYSGDRGLQVENRSDTEVIVTFSTCEFLKHFQTASHPSRVNGEEVTISSYHPILASFEETDDTGVETADSASSADDKPPPIPPQAFEHFEAPEHTYQHVSYRKDMSEGQCKYIRQRLAQMNIELIRIHGEARIEIDLLEVRPLECAHSIADWTEQVTLIVNQHMSEYQEQSVSVDIKTKNEMLEYLQLHRQKYNDFNFEMSDHEYLISGGPESFHKALEDLNNMSEQKEEEITREIKREPHLIDYFLTFYMDEINSISPPVTITRSKDNPGVVVVRGVKQSLDRIEEIARDKFMNSISIEYIPITEATYFLLSGNKGKQKMKKALGQLLDSVQYTFEMHNLGKYTHQLYIVSSKGPNAAFVKREFEKVSREEVMIIPEDKRGVTSGIKWQQLITGLTDRFFVSVNTSPDTITVSGDETDIRAVTDEIRKFLEHQDEVSKEVSVSGPKMLVIKTSKAHELDQLIKDAARKKVYVTSPMVNEDTVNASFLIHGNLKHVEKVGDQLHQLISEVQTKDFSVPPKAGMRKVVEKGMLKAKCAEVGRSSQVIVRYSTETDGHMDNDQLNDLNSPKRIISSTAPTGIRVSVHIGNYAHQTCDAIVTFIPDDPQFDEPIFTMLVNTGGQEVLDNLELSLSSQRLYAPSIHHTRCTGNIKCNELIHIVLPRLNLSMSASFQLQHSALKTKLQEVIDEVSHKYNSIVLCPLTIPPLNYPGDLFADCVVEAVSNVRSGKYTVDLNVQVFIDNECEGDDFEMAMKQNGFHIHSAPCVQHVPAYRPTPQKVHGTSQSLERIVKISYGDMLDLQTEVYINSTGPEMNFNKGTLAKRFKDTCGQKLMDEVNEYLKYEKTLKYGKVAVTSAKGLNAEAIYHIALKPRDEPGYERSFRETAKNILLTAKEYGHRSIAIPCLGVVGLGYSPQLSARILFDEVISFHYKYPSAITLFHFIVHRDEDRKPFEEEYSMKILQFEKVSSSQQAQPQVANTSDKRFGNLDVKIVRGDLSKEQTEVIVNSTSIDMKENANQISKAIFASAGDELRDTCNSLVSSGLLLEDGIVIPTNASGELRCDKIYHVHVPGKAKRDVPPTILEAQLLKKVISDCLETAEEAKQESISFPMFCIGIGNYTVEQSGGLMLEALEKFSRMPPKHLEQVRIVILDKQRHDEFVAFYNQWTTSNKGSSDVTRGSNGTIGSVVSNSMGSSFSQAAGHNGKGSAHNGLTCKKTGVHFHLYGIKKDMLEKTEADIKLFINEIIVTDMVELGETFYFFYEDDMKQFHDLAFQYGVEIDVQEAQKRIMVTGEEADVEKICGKIQHKKVELQSLTQELQMFQWFSENSFGELEPYPLEAMKQIEVANRRSRPSINLTVDRVSVKIDFQQMKEYNSAGTVRKTKVVRKRKQFEIEIPAEWGSHPRDSQGTPKVVHYEPIPQYSPEYIKATKRFTDTLDKVDCTIISVKRVQNPGEYSRYQSLKTSWISIHGPGVVKEREVFHGTKSESIGPICSQGFNRIFAADNNAAHYGKGVYFALNASYSTQDKYSAKDKDGHKYILVCTLLVGKYTRGRKTMKIAPPLLDNPQVLYDTLVDNDSAPTIFVAMKDSQAYPKYLITFKKNN